jgi:hypothetical protein
VHAITGVTVRGVEVEVSIVEDGGLLHELEWVSGRRPNSDGYRNDHDQEPSSSTLNRAHHVRGPGGRSK